MMLKREPLSSKGVTLVELLIVIVVMGIISAFAVPNLNKVVGNVQENLQIINMQNIKNFIDQQLLLYPVDDDHMYTYKRSGSADDSYFSTFLETTWEVTNGPGDADNTNIVNFTNSVSGKLGVVNWHDAPALNDDLYCNQSLYITTDSDASYEINNPQTIDSCYAGSIVIWYDDNSADNIFVYYVDSEGLQTKQYFIYLHISVSFNKYNTFSFSEVF